MRFTCCSMDLYLGLALWDGSDGQVSRERACDHMEEYHGTLVFLLIMEDFCATIQALATIHSYYKLP